MKWSRDNDSIFLPNWCRATQFHCVCKQTIRTHASYQESFFPSAEVGQLGGRLDEHGAFRLRGRDVDGARVDGDLGPVHLEPILRNRFGRNFLMKS
jgi:hypothetical protein